MSVKFVFGGALDPSFKGALDKSVAEAERAAARINAALRSRTRELEQRAGKLPEGSAARAQIENQIILNHEKIAETAHRSEYKRHLERKRMLVDEARTTGQMMGADLSGAGLRQQKISDYLLRKKAIMGTTGSGMAPGFAKLIASEMAAGGGKGGATYLGPASAKAFGGAASAMFVSVARDTAASLASGANPMVVFMQQAPQVAQAFTMMGKSALGFVKTLLMSPWTWAVAGAVALGGAIYALYSHYQKAIEAGKNLASMTDYTNRSFIDQIKIIKDVIAAQREHVAWLKKQREAQIDNKLESEKALDALRERHALEMESARRKGGSPQSLETLSIKQKREELELIKEARDQARLAWSDERSRVEAAVKAQQKFLNEKGPTGEAQLVEAANKEAENAKIAEAARLELKKRIANEETVTEGTGKFITVQTGTGAANVEQKVQRPFNENDKLKFEVDGQKHEMSVQTAALMLRGSTTDKNKLEGVSKDLDEAVKSARTKSESAQARYNRLNEEAKKEDRTLKGTESLPPERKGQRGGTQMLEWERAGGFLGGPQVALLDVNKSMDKKLGHLVEMARGGKARISPWGGR